ncbi:MAG: hypothetical protein AAF402_06860 [Pseudomonadota bacterium]
MKTFFIIAVAVLVTGCSGLIQTGTVSRAYESFSEKDYTTALEMISLAQKVQQMTPELEAELSFLKGRTYAALGEDEKSEEIFRALVATHQNTEHGYLASERLAQAAQDD